MEQTKLFLRTSKNYSVEEKNKLLALLDSKKISGIIVAYELDLDIYENVIMSFLEKAKSSDAVVLSLNTEILCADGMVFESNNDDYEGKVANLRSRLGQDKIVGASCFNSSDRAMAAGEEDADFVIFGAGFAANENLNYDPELVSDWLETTTTPLMIHSKDFNKPKDFQPDFLILGQDVINAEEPIRVINHLLGLV